MPRIPFGLGADLDTKVTFLLEGYHVEATSDLMIITFPSKRNPDHKYTVKHSPLFTICNCSGFKYNEHCWHSDFARDKIKFPAGFSE